MHSYSVFTNSCLKVPVDPYSKMPKTAYERSEKNSLEQLSVDSSISVSLSGDDLDSKKLKDFYRSIPDYNDINHLPANEFYSTLKRLREKKKIMLIHAIEEQDIEKSCSAKYLNELTASELCNLRKTKSLSNERRKSLDRHRDNTKNKGCSTENIAKEPKNADIPQEVSVAEDKIPATKTSSLVVTGTGAKERPRRNHSACSISWHDDKADGRNEVDEKFEKFFDGVQTSNLSTDYNEYKTRSMPTSPLRSRCVRTGKYKSVTVPKPFKMTERDEEERMVNELRTIQKSFSDDMLNRKFVRKQFKAKPVPIESRIPLYEKILEDQAMRRAVTKINSEAELRARMKPFSFTKREECCNNGICERADHVIPKPKKKKRFKARPVPKNLFSNYFYDKIKEDNYFRTMNRRIRAEEMLRSASVPGSLGRDRSRQSTPAAHSELPRDPSVTSDRPRPNSPMKEYQKRSKENFITTSPQPFRFNTAERADKKLKSIQKKIIEDRSTSSSNYRDQGVSEPSKAYSALELNNIAVGRSNLAALLRAEAVRRKFELDAARRLAEHRRKLESKYRDKQLRSKPAWTLVKNNHEEDIAMRLQTRRDEERLRREEFLHEMELMYNRVHQQPLLFERYYAPRPPNVEIDFSQLSPRKIPKKKNGRKKKASHSSCRSLDFQDDVEKYLFEKTDKFEYSDVIDSVERS